MNKGYTTKTRNNKQFTQFVDQPNQGNAIEFIRELK